MKLTPAQYNVANAVGLNLVWIAAVAGAAAGHAWFGPLAAALFVCGHLPFADRFDVRFVLVLTPLGIAVDSLYAASGMISYASPWPWAQAAPAWIVALWISFALTLRHSLRLFTERPALGAVLGLVFGPLSYWFAGNVWGAAVFHWSTPLWFSIIGVTWLGVMLLAHWLLGLERRQTLERATAPVA